MITIEFHNKYKDMLSDLIKMVLVEGEPLQTAASKYCITPHRVRELIYSACRQRNYQAWKQSQANYDGLKGLRRLAERFIETENA